MSVNNILEQAQALGISLTVAGDRIRYWPQLLAPAEFVQLLREHKAALMTYLAQHSAQRVGPAADAQQLLAWASSLAEQDLVLAQPVRFLEEPLRPMDLYNLSKYVRRQVRFIAHARLQQRTGGMGDWLPPWWREQEAKAIGALAALRAAMDRQEGGESSHD
ncbi:MAG: hypothetical protein FJ316_10700 [SAR202 cluster bacterium]|nr:hypothetical protein [SAR202 cluster bacterium]